MTLASIHVTEGLFVEIVALVALSSLMATYLTAQYARGKGFPFWPVPSPASSSGSRSSS